MRIAAVFLACLAITLGIPHRLDAQDPLAEARQLYASAEYEKALSALEGAVATNAAAERRGEIELYRALCLLAVGRPGDADHAIERIFTHDPLYRLPDDISPRMRTAFISAKKTVLPVIVQQHFNNAKTAFDLEDFVAAATGFSRVVDALHDPDIAQVAKLPPLADLLTLAVGFRDLSAKAIPPPGAPPPVETPPVTLPPTIYTINDPGVVPPLTIQQEIPRFPRTAPRGGMSGSVEIIIGTTGAVEAASMVVPIMPAYDRTILTAAMSWSYRPATREGVPVKFRKRIQINVSPSDATTAR